MPEQRKIIHIDADSFYASVETRDNPELRGKPLAVGGRADRRGVIATANYEARTFGIHSAMASSRAMALCPGLLILPPRFELYRDISAQFHVIFRDYADLVEPLSPVHATADRITLAGYGQTPDIPALSIPAEHLDPERAPTFHAIGAGQDPSSQVDVKIFEIGVAVE